MSLLHGMRKFKKLFYEKTEYYDSLLEQQRPMYLEGNTVPAEELHDAITKSKAERNRVGRVLIKHRAFHS